MPVTALSLSVNGVVMVKAAGTKVADWGATLTVPGTGAVLSPPPEETVTVIDWVTKALLPPPAA